MRRSLFGGIGLIIVAVVVLVGWLAVFTVDPTKQALVLRFGDPIRSIIEPGLYFKVPLVDNVEYIERRVLDLDSPPFEVTVRSEPGEEEADVNRQVGQRLVVDAFGRYRIVNPLLFYQAAGSVAVADQRLQTLLNSAVRRVLGEATLFQVVRDQRAVLMERITAQVDNEALTFGVKVVDVKIRSADLPEANSQAIYQRMQTERQREATEIRAEGEQASRRIRAQAERDATVIVALAEQEASQLRGDGDASVNRIFAEAYQRDPAFFAFYRSMQAYQQGLQAGSTRLLMSPDSDFFRFFKDLNGASPPGGEGEAGGAGDPEVSVLPLPDAIVPAPDAAALPDKPPAAPAPEPVLAAPAEAEPVGQPAAVVAPADAAEPAPAEPVGE